MTAPYKRDWQKTRIHAVCGFVVGGGTVLLSGGGWMAALVWAVIFGLLAGIFLDRFWDHLRSWWS